MRPGKYLVVFILIFIFASTAFAQTHTSANYILTNPRIVLSGGKAGSTNYSLSNVEVGNLTSGKAESANYTLEAYPLNVVYSDFCPTEIFDDFDGENPRVECWWSGFNGDAVYKLSLDGTIFRSGSTSMKVEYNKLGYPWSFFALQPKENGIDNDFSKYDKLSFWVYTEDPQLIADSGESCHPIR